MMPAKLAALLLLPLLPAQSLPGAAKLSLAYTGDRVEFRVTGPETKFLGGVLLSLNPNVCHYYQLLPPTLCDHVVLGVGMGRGSYTASALEGALPAGISIYAQGLIADSDGIDATKVVSFVLDGSANR